MHRTLKTLGLALFATLALGVTASSAMAANHVFTSVNEVETVTGTGEGHVLELTDAGLSVECTTAQFHGTVANGAGEMTLAPHYTGTPPPPNHEGHCGSSLGTVDVEMKGCQYVLTGETNENEHADVWIECVDNDEIELKMTEVGMTLYIPAQTPTEGGVRYINNGDHVDIETTVQGITYTCKPAFLCGLVGISTHGNDADYTGSVTMHGARGPISVSGL